jgi:hypothetical protein
MLAPYDTLEVICRRCLAGEVLEPDEMSWLGQAVTVRFIRRMRSATSGVRAERLSLSSTSNCPRGALVAAPGSGPLQ